MSVITTKFSLGDTCYTFDHITGIIYRNTIDEVRITSKSGDMEVLYSLSNIFPVRTEKNRQTTEYEQNLYTETEIKDLANTWLINKSVSIFSNAGL